jgi:hypothetical protein
VDDPVTRDARHREGTVVRIVLNLVGLILACFGVLWILQGLQSRWGILGAAVLIAAIVILLGANRKKT